MKPLWNTWIAAAATCYAACGLDEDVARAAALSLWYDSGGRVPEITPEQAVDNDLAEAGDMEK